MLHVEKRAYSLSPITGTFLNAFTSMKHPTPGLAPGERSIGSLQITGIRILFMLTELAEMRTSGAQ
jgi:hypothetical protein